MAEGKTQHAQDTSERPGLVYEFEPTEQVAEAQFVRALLDVSREISSVRKLEEILQLVVDRTRELLGFDLAAIATVDTAEGATSWKAASGFRTDVFKTVQFAPGRGTAGRAIEARRTIILKGVGENPDLPAEEFPIHRAEQILCSIGVPLILGERIVGVVIAGNRTGNEISAQQIRFAEAIAAQVAIAIENARLFTQLAAANLRLMEADRLKTEMLLELSTPVIPIWERILLAPIIGTLTANRAQVLTHTLLERTANGGAEIVILDITGVGMIDTDAAQHLRNTVSALRVLGAQCIVTGIRASVAQTLVHLGISFEDITTRRRLSDALHLAVEKMNQRQVLS